MTRSLNSLRKFLIRARKRLGRQRTIHQTVRTHPRADEDGLPAWPSATADTTRAPSSHPLTFYPPLAPQTKTIMLSIASIQTTAFAGSAVGASKVAPQMQFGSFGQKKAAAPAKAAFAYGLPGNFNAVGGSDLDWDPAGFLEGKSELEINRYRECELTHGRVGMLASLGFLVQEKFHPLFSADGGPAIDQIPQLPVWLWVVMGAGITAAESYRISVAFRELDGEKLKAETALRPGYQPGNLGFDPLNLLPEDPAEIRLMQEKELAHARLGMIAAAGFLAQEAVTKATWGTAIGAPDF